MMGSGNCSISKDSRDPFTMDNGATPCAAEPSCSKHLKNGSHPLTASPQSADSVRGGKIRGRDGTE